MSKKKLSKTDLGAIDEALEVIRRNFTDSTGSIVIGDPTNALKQLLANHMVAMAAVSYVTVHVRREARFGLESVQMPTEDEIARINRDLVQGKMKFGELVKIRNSIFNELNRK